MGSVGVKVTEPVELAPGVWRAGTAFVNWYLLEEDGRVTIVDAGLPRYRPQLDRALERMGRSLADVAAIVLTHAHPDHVGLAEPLRVELGVPVHVHAGDEQLARTKKAAANPAAASARRSASRRRARSPPGRCPSSPPSAP